MALQYTHALFRNAPRDAKLRPLGLELSLPAPPDVTSQPTTPPTPPSAPASPSADKTDNSELSYCPDAPDMRREEERLKTFERWPLAFPAPEVLAKNGFYYLGRGDEVRCVFCKVEINRWVEDDDPAAEHLRWAPQCPSFRTPDSPGAVAAAAAAAGRDECGLRPRPAPGPVHPRYASEAARLRSFRDWPRSMRQKPEELADAGFFYTGQGDKTKCFYCDGGLKDWEDEDVPWEQHARWFDKCAYVQIVRGRDYVKKVKSDAVEKPVEKETSEPAPAPAPAVIASPVDDKSTDGGDKEEDDSRLCKICFAAERNVCFVPCGHVVACAKCALSTDKCPMCRRTFQNAVRLYFS